jgi:hypothetical protein
MNSEKIEMSETEKLVGSLWPETAKEILLSLIDMRDGLILRFDPERHHKYHLEMFVRVAPFNTRPRFAASGKTEHEAVVEAIDSIPYFLAQAQFPQENVEGFLRQATRGFEDKWYDPFWALARDYREQMGQVQEWQIRKPT